MNFKKLFPYFIAFFAFIVVSLGYFSPVLKGEKIYQSDIAQHTGMAKEILDFRVEYQEEPYWTNTAFGGMPAYQVSAYFPHDYLKTLDRLIRFLPRPADYLFLYFIGFFVLMLVLKVDWRLAILGALGFGFSTYLIIILGVGHNAKAHAIGYIPLVIAGVVLLFRKKYFSGFVLTTLAAALEITTGHIQMTYYLFLMLFIYVILQMIRAIKEKEGKHFLKTLGILLVAGIFAIGMNANHLLPTREYAKESTRSKSELSLNPEGKPKEITGGLSKDYITEYSYGILETFNLFIPRFMGGSNAENLGTQSHTYSFLSKKIGGRQAKDFSRNAPTYWGKQPIVAAPAYIGAVLIFLFVLSLFLLKPKTRNWLLYGLILALLLSWGKNFSFLTELFIDYVPLYNKFRAVSYIQVLIELAVPVLGILGLQKLLFDKKLSEKKKINALKYAGFITGGLALFFVLFGRSWFSFEGIDDSYYDSLLPGFSEALIQDRKNLFFKDSLRSFFLVLVACSSLWLFIKNKLKTAPVLGILAFLLLYDLIGIDRRYVNADDFQSASSVEKPFVASAEDKNILQDTTYYRVGNFSVNLMNDARTSYFHKSIGGYHAAKLRRYQELFDYQIAKNNLGVLSMLNTKYILLPDPDESQKTLVEKNENAYGNAWFATDIRWVETADEELSALDSITPTTAILRKKYRKALADKQFFPDTTASIQLTSYKLNEMRYKSHSQTPQLAVFSEIYYPHGWSAFIDGEEQEILPVNYVLRALVLPEGTHDIVFTFNPQVVKKGGMISLTSYLLFLVLISWGFFKTIRFFKIKRVS